VVRASELRRSDQTYQSKDMQPFFHYAFYTFDHTSAVVAGPNPFFDERKQYEVEMNQQLTDYLRSQILEVHFIDDSVDLNKGQNDYIGTVRIPLRELLTTGKIHEHFAITDDSGKENGSAEISITVVTRDASESIRTLRGEHGLQVTRAVERDVLQKIAKKFSEAPNDDCDVLFSLFLEGRDLKKDEITKKRFKDVLLLDFKLQGVREEDLNIFLRTHPDLASKDTISLADFKHVFEQAIANAKQEQMEEEEFKSRAFREAEDVMGRSGTTRAFNPFS